MNADPLDQLVRHQAVALDVLLAARLDYQPATTVRARATVRRPHGAGSILPHVKPWITSGRVGKPNRP